MSKSFRLSLVAGLVLGLSQVGFAGVTMQEPAANAETAKTSSSVRSAKKKKKRKETAPVIVVLGAYAQPTISAPLPATPVATTTADVPPPSPAPAPAARGSVSATRVSGLSVTPIVDPPSAN